MKTTKHRFLKFKDINSFDFSSYGRELTREESYLVNGGAHIENSIEAQAQAQPGDTITNSSGNTFVLNEADILWAQQQLGYTETTNDNLDNASTDESVAALTHQEQYEMAQAAVNAHNNENDSSMGNNTVPVSNTQSTQIVQDSQSTTDSYPNDFKKTTNEESEIKLKYVDQKTVGKDLGLPEDKTCLLTDWIIAYMNEGLTYDRCIQVIKGEIVNGNISVDDSEMNNQLATSKALAKELKGENFDGLYLQYPWPDGKQVLFYSEKDFFNSSYPYGIGIFKGLQGAKWNHYEFYSNNPDEKLDPWPGGVEICSNWTTTTLKLIQPIGWYK